MFRSKWSCFLEDSLYTVCNTDGLRPSSFSPVPGWAWGRGAVRHFKLIIAVHLWITACPLPLGYDDYGMWVGGEGVALPLWTGPQIVPGTGLFTFWMLGSQCATF